MKNIFYIKCHYYFWHYMFNNPHSTVPFRAVQTHRVEIIWLIILNLYLWNQFLSAAVMTNGEFYFFYFSFYGLSHYRRWWQVLVPKLTFKKLKAIVTKNLNSPFDSKLADRVTTCTASLIHSKTVFITMSSGKMIRSNCFYPPPLVNLETAACSSNNCRLAVGGFLWGGSLQRKLFQAVPLQMFFFPKARSLYFILSPAPVFPPVLRLFWGTICVLGPGFICWCSAKGRRGRQMKPINHLTGYKR